MLTSLVTRSVAYNQQFEHPNSERTSAADGCLKPSLLNFSSLQEWKCFPSLVTASYSSSLPIYPKILHKNKIPS